ncbi:MAG TPA: polysaccharide pyruvyl transferase family protein, partial [Patescibacteria group bacterium]|nr:polysaccharide pyruvyl transferase family protein [Patescibacteria group bacterium]
GYWLMPTLLGRACGVPVAWNCLGVSSGTPAWARRVLALAVAETPYVSVRDEPSARELQDVSPRARIRIVPDSAFGIQALLPRQPSAAFQSFCATTGLARPYILVQASRQLQQFTPQLKTAVAAARAKGCQVLELPISPVLGVCSGVLELNAQTIAPQTWPEPLLIAELIANAEAVIAQSLHLTIVALASGVPVHRPHIGEESKYGHIEFIEGVHLWNSGVDAAAEMRKGMGKHSPGVRITEIKAQLSRHWDTIAKLAAKPVQARPQITAAILNDCFRAAEECSGPHEQNGVSDTNGKLAPTGTVPAQGAQLDRRLAQLEQKTESLATARIHLQRLVEQQADQIRDLVARSNELEGKLQENATEAREQLQRQEAYYGLIARVRCIVRETLPAHSIITVVSNGDDQFLSFGSHTGWHFPRTETGLYLGRHPTNSAEAIAELDRQRFKGAQYLLFPETSFWWFESYPELTSHLQAHYRLVLNREDTCRIYSLRERT